MIKWQERSSGNGKLTGIDELILRMVDGILNSGPVDWQSMSSEQSLWYEYKGSSYDIRRSWNSNKIYHRYPANKVT